MIVLDAAPNPDWVYAGWMPLALTAVIALVVLALYFNMRKHMRRSDERFEREAEDASQQPSAPRDATAASERTPD